MNIRALRQSVDMSQKQLAITMRVSQPTVSDWEQGKTLPSSKNMVRLAEVFGVTMQELIGGKEQPVQNPKEIIIEQRKEEAYRLMKDMSQSEIDQVRQYIAFIKSQRK